MALNNRSKIQIEIRTVQELNLLLERYSQSKHDKRVRRIKICLDSVPRDQNDRYSEKINRLVFACGCREGAIAFYTAVFALLCFQLITQNLDLSIISVAICIGVLIIAIGLGKFIGKEIAKRKLVNELRNIKETIIKSDNYVTIMC